LRAICLAYLDCEVSTGDAVAIDVRGRTVQALAVDRHLKNDKPPYARAVLHRGS
jgi:hypothetical protein